ncbi:MAG: A/G-specific adenine glycosylase [Patescibacteria group bacterium]
MNSADFRKTVYAHYRRHRRDLPWRHTTNPYHIMVSEIMLQQTQVDRVIKKYKSFIKKFPTIRSLSRAPLSSVLKEWQGLGYNRRAKYVHMAARHISTQGTGRFPHTTDGLVSLPGIGVHTAGAICAYAFNQPVTYIETNIRTVFIHHFFPRRTQVSDAELLPVVLRTLDHRNPRRWYSALMDYGTWLKKEHGNAARRSRHYTRHSPFQGSHRQVRGGIIRQLTTGRAMTAAQLRRTLGVPLSRISRALEELQAEGLVTKRDGTIYLSRY